MLHMPRRSVTRFFIPLIDVLTLLFCVFLVMPLAKGTGEDAAPTVAEELKRAQAEIDRLWSALTEGGATERCGWLKDRWGLSWQIIPRRLGELMSDPDRFKFHGDQHYLKTAGEMRSLFREVPESCDNTLWIAERAKVDIEFGKPQLPNFPIPAGFADDAAYLEHLTFEGARER